MGAAELMPKKPAGASTSGKVMLRRRPEVVQLSAGAKSGELAFAKTGGVCDGNNIQAATDNRLAVIDTLGVRGGGLHTLDEWVELDSLVERAQLTALLIERIAAGGLEGCAT